jgi:hypothetical protein
VPPGGDSDSTATPPPPPCFPLDLWNQRLTGGLSLQNIDNKDFGYKFFEMNILRLRGAMFGGFQTKKQKGCACAASFPDYLIPL